MVLMILLMVSDDCRCLHWLFVWHLNEVGPWCKLNSTKSSVFKKSTSFFTSGSNSKFQGWFRWRLCFKIYLRNFVSEIMPKIFNKSLSSFSRIKPIHWYDSNFWKFLVPHTKGLILSAFIWKLRSFFKYFSKIIE